jgi:hypothetical protein
MKLLHNKLRNTAIIFELLSKKLTSEILTDSNPIAINLIKKYYHKSELASEYALYEALINTRGLDAETARITCEEAKNYYDKIDKKELATIKYNLINEINRVYNKDDFFKIRVDNYKLLASICNLIESYNTNKSYDISDVVQNKQTILEHLTSSDSDGDEITMLEYNKLTKGEKNLVFKLMVESYNETYDSVLTDTQKGMMLEYITNVSVSPTYSKLLNNRMKELKESFQNKLNFITDDITKVKLNEVIDEMQFYKSGYIVNENDVTKFLYYYELEDEINKFVK